MPKQQAQNPCQMLILVLMAFAKASTQIYPTHHTLSKQTRDNLESFTYTTAICNIVNR